MKKIIIRTLLLFSFGILAVFSAAMLLVASDMNRKAADGNAAALLSVYEARMHDGRYGVPGFGDYEKLAAVSVGAENIRVTVIGTDGWVLADTLADPAAAKDHSTRKEVIEALKGGTGTDIHRSETLGASGARGPKFLYKAKLVEVEGAAPVILRVAIPVKSINSYLYGALLTTALIFMLAFAATAVFSRFIADRLNKPFVLVKEKLDGVLDPAAEVKPIVLTKHDDINAVLRDIDEISEKLNATLAEFQSEARKLDLVLGNIDQGIIAVDGERRIVFCNKAAEDYFGFEFTTPLTVAKAIRNKTLLDNIGGAVEKNEFVSFDVSRPGGSIFEIRIFPVDSREISLIVTAQNVTNVRKVALEKQEFFQNAGHELNTPLSSVIGYSEMLLSMDNGQLTMDNEGQMKNKRREQTAESRGESQKIINKKKIKAFAETINREAMRMKLLIEGMMKISALEENQEIIDENFDLKKVIEQAAAAAAPKAEKKGIKLTSDLDACIVCANPEKLTEAAANLIDNAIKYTEPGGNVRVGLKVAGGKAVLSVKDDGIGIPAASLSRVFERFYRVDKGRSKTEGGTGLGLAIVKHICNHYNAPIKIQSTENAGTEITVAFNCVS